MVEAGTLQLDAALQDRFVQLGIPTETDGIEERTGSELREQVEAMGAAMGVSTAMGDGPRAARGGALHDHRRPGGRFKPLSVSIPGTLGLPDCAWSRPS